MIRAALVAGALLASPAQAQEVLTPGQMQTVARAALVDGNWLRAETFARALLQRDAADPVALAILARLALEAGVPGDAVGYGRDLFAASPPGAARFDAARTVALAMARQDRWLAASVWLRRAAVHATSAAELDQLADDVRSLRSASPVSLSLSFGLAPSDNVNGGSEGALNIVDGLPFVGQLSPDARALSGWAGTGDVRLAFRLLESAASRTNLTLHAFARAVWLSDAARAFIAAEREPDDPPISGADFSSALVEVELAHQFALPQGAGQVDLTIGRQMSGRDDWTDSLTLGGLRRFDLGQGGRVDLSLSREWRTFDGDQADEIRDRFTADLAWLLGDDRLMLSGGLSRTLTDNLNAAATGWTLQAGYDLGQQVGPFALGFQAGFQMTDYADYRVLLPVPGGRQDARMFASLSATLPSVSYAGFSPVVTLGWDATDSNVSRFARDGWSVDLSLRSSF